MGEKYIRTSLLFEHLIDDPAWMPYFLDFLSRHEQSHLLLFWLEVEVFELAAGGGPSLVTQATRIYDSYLGPDAPKRLELPPQILAFIQEEVGAGSPNINVFGAAHAWVYWRLKQTWYPAFLLSSTYQSLLEHLKKSFSTPLREMLVDEVQSRYLEAFLLNCDAQFPPAAVGNIYLWKKIHKDLRGPGTRLARGRPGDSRDAEDIKLFIADARATYEAYIHPGPSPPSPLQTPSSSSSSSSSGRGQRRAAATAPPTATALPRDLRQRTAESLSRLVGQSRYYASLGGSANGSILAGTQLAAAERQLVGELTGHLMEAQRVVFAWLETEVFPAFLRSWLCGVLSGDVQARRSAPLRRKRRLRTLFKSIRPFRHVYVPPCPRSDGRGLVLVSTEGCSSPPPPLRQELVWAFDVAVFPARGPPAITVADLRSDAVEEEEEDSDDDHDEGEEEENEDASGPSPHVEAAVGEDEDGGGLAMPEDESAVEGLILSSKGGSDSSGVFHLSPQQTKKGKGRRGKDRRPLRFCSAIRASQATAAALLAAEGHDGGKEEEDDDAAALMAGLADRLTQEIQRLALPSLCLMPLERSAFVLFSPKLLVPEPAFHHFVLPIRRREVDRRLQHALPPPCPFPKSPRAAVVSPHTGDAVDAPDLAANEHVLLYGCSLVEWAPAGDEVLLPRCLTLLSTEPRFESLRQALLAMRGGALPSSMAGLSPLTPGTPKKTPWQLEQEERARSSTSASAPLLEAAVLGRRQCQGTAPTTAAALRYWRRAAQGGYGALAAAVGASTRGGVDGGNSTNAASAAAAPPPSAPPPLLRLPPPLTHVLPQEVDVSFVPLFHALSPETLLRALTAVLLERPVVVQSASRTLTTLACEAFRRLLHPFTWLRPFMPLLPVAGICAFWDETRRASGGQSWFDYVFEDDGLDDSLVAAAGEAYVEPATTAGAALRAVPGFLVGLEACIADAALSAPKVTSPAYSGSSCHAWACSGTCEVHPDGGAHAAAAALLSPTAALFTPGGGLAPPTTRTPRTDAALQAAASARLTGGGVNSTTKYGELPPCIKASARALLTSAVVVDLDRDTVTEPRRGDPSTALPPLPEEAAASLLAAVQRVVNPTLDGNAGYGVRAVQAARAAGAGARGKQGGKRGSKQRTTTTPPPTTPEFLPRRQRGKEEEGEDSVTHPNQLLHGAFAAFFHEMVLGRYREYTLSFLEEQVVAFHADAFLASQPEGSHAFWVDFFQTRLFAHFLLLEHRRVAETFEKPLPVAPPRPDNKPLSQRAVAVASVDV